MFGRSVSSVSLAVCLADSPGLSSLSALYSYLSVLSFYDISLCGMYQYLLCSRIVYILGLVWTEVLLLDELFFL